MTDLHFEWQDSEICCLVHIHRQQYRIYRTRRQHMHRRRRRLLLRVNLSYGRDFSAEIKLDFIQVVLVSPLPYRCTKWTFAKIKTEKSQWKLQNMLCAVLDKSRKYHPTKLRLYVSLNSISQNSQATFSNGLPRGYAVKQRIAYISSARTLDDVSKTFQQGRIVRQREREKEF